MNKLKDKLTASMRTVQRTEDAEEGTVKGSERTQPAATRPAARVRQASGRASDSTASTGFDTPPQSTGLFPSRVWPD